MARQHGDARYVLARKGAKLYMRDIFQVDVRSITTDHEQHLYLDGEDAAMMKGKKNPHCRRRDLHRREPERPGSPLVRKAGGTICGRMAILAEGRRPGTGRTSFIWKSCPLFHPDGTVMAE